MVVGIKDIAKKAGCSEATVSLALNGSSLVADKTKKIILEIADEIGYIPNLSARNLARKKSGCIGLIIPDIENVFYSSLVKYINQETIKRGYKLIISLSENDRETENHMISTMIENRIEGVVFVPMSVPNLDTSYLEQLDKYYIPYVFCNDYYEAQKDKAPVVMSDLENGMYDIVKKAVSYGYKNIAYLTGDDGVTSLKLRNLGFKRAAEESNVNYSITCLEKINNTMAQKAVCKILKDNPETDVFIGVNDMVAIGIVNGLNEMCYSVPQDKGVAGFDNVIFSKVSYPKISTISQDVEEMARRCVQMLIDGENKDVIIPTHYVERESLRQQTI